MLQEKYLDFCIYCQHKGFDENNEIICNLTGKAPEFDDKCENFIEAGQPEAKIVEKQTTEKQQYPKKDISSLEADLWKRFFNYLIDQVIIVFVMTFVFIVITVAFGVKFLHLINNNYLLRLFVSIILTFMYYFIMESSFGVTIGKLITNTVVVDENLKQPTIKQIFLRTAARFIPFEPFSFFPGRGWHDSMSETYVVSRKKLAEHKITKQ